MKSTRQSSKSSDRGTDIVPSKAQTALRSGWFARLERQIIWNMSAAMFVIALALMMLESLSRVMFSHSFFWVEELSRFLILWAFFLSLGITGRQGQHIRMSFVVDNVSPAVRRIMNIVAALGGVLFCPILGYGFYKQVERLMASGIRTESDLNLPMWMIVGVLLIGTALYFFYFLHCLYLAATGLDPFGEPHHEAPETEAAA